MNTLASWLPTVLEQLPLSDECFEQVVIALWEQVVGKPLMQNARPLRLHQSTLIVNVSSDAWKRELHGLRFEILKRLEAIVGKSRITTLEFRVDPWMSRPAEPIEHSIGKGLESAPVPLMPTSDSELNRSLAAAASSYFSRTSTFRT
jgi:hypothetical protein